MYEPDLQETLLNAVKNGYLKCMLNREEAVLNTDISFITVATPSQPDGSIDLRYIKNCIIVTEWEEHKKLKPEDFTQNMRQPILIDGRRIYNPKEFSQKLKFAAIGLGQ